MIIIACVDDNLGMMFNHRRQSKDKLVYEKISQTAIGKKIKMNKYSSELFEEKTANLCICQNFMDHADPDDFCFVENTNLGKYEEKVNGIILFKWNRVYPADSYFELDLGKWTCVKLEEFKGSSHEKITMEVYE